jgi:hypothetical protein
VLFRSIYDNPDDCTDIEAIEERLYIIPECGLMSNPLALERRKQQIDTESLNNSVKMLLGNGFGFSNREN